MMRLFMTVILMTSAAMSQQPSRPKKAIDIEGLKIEAELQKPEVFFILQRDDKDFLNTLTLDPREQPEKTIERFALSDLFK